MADRSNFGELHEVLGIRDIRDAILLRAFEVLP
jgi:hypothetical protein